MKFGKGPSSALSFAWAFALAGCASMPRGAPNANEAILINTNPAGANCTLEREGELLTRIEGTPSFVTVKRGKYHITILCNKTGFQEASYIILGGGVGSTAGSDSGADSEYDAVANLTLLPIGASTPPTAAAHAPVPPPQPIAVGPPTP